MQRRFLSCQHLNYNIQVNNQQFGCCSNKTCKTSLTTKYPNIELRIIQASGGVSGTAARNAIKNNNKEYSIHDYHENFIMELHTASIISYDYENKNKMRDFNYISLRGMPESITAPPDI